MIRSLLCTAAATTFVFAAIGSSPASALFHTIQGSNVGMTCNLGGSVTPVGGYNENGVTPLSETINCFTAGSFADGGSSSSPGHVGAESNSHIGLDGFGARLDTTAVYSDFFVFTSVNPAATTADVQLRLGLAGLLQASGPAATASVDFQVTFIGQDVGRLIASEDTTGVPQCTSSFTGGVGCGTIFFPSNAETAMLTRLTTVGLNAPIFIQMRMDVGTSASNFGSGSGAQFNNSLDFPIGGPLFILPDGVTVNAPDSFVFDNVFAPPGATAVPEPSTLALLWAGLAGIGLTRRR